jgi:hypothetical protein
VRWIKKRYKKRREYRYKHYDLGLPAKLNGKIEPYEKKDFELDFTSRETAEKETINITMTRDKPTEQTRSQKRE